MKKFFFALTLISAYSAVFADNSTTVKRPDVLVTSGSEAAHSIDSDGFLSHIGLTLITNDCEKQDLINIYNHASNVGASFGVSSCDPAYTYKNAYRVSVSWGVQYYGVSGSKEYHGALREQAEEVAILEVQIQANTLEACKQTEQLELEKLKKRARAVVFKSGCLERTKEVPYRYNSMIFYRNTVCSQAAAAVEANGGGCGLSALLPDFYTCTGKDGSKFALQADPASKTGCSIRMKKKWWQS